ncbi:MAG: penicillin-binding transpeptidase domain-containing protein [Verrucomicrobiae bacterium]|nr:penicillin-binding transpeptidase domain-containing protein [Verrucomicrobiae bacterium]
MKNPFLKTVFHVIRPALCLFALLACHSLAAGDFIVLETEPEGGAKAVEGDPAAAGKTFSPMSTFKIIIAWAALETGTATPATTHRCTDRFIPGAPRDLTMANALFFSSNQYFVWLTKKMGANTVASFLNRSELLGHDTPENWLAEGLDSVVHAGNLQVSPNQQHAFILRVMKGQLASSQKIQSQLLECMVWPSGEKDILLYGKTGSSTGLAWFNGFGGKKDQFKAVTVLLKGKDANRDRAIRHFYARFGLKPPNLSPEALAKQRSLINYFERSALHPCTCEAHRRPCFFLNSSAFSSHDLKNPIHSSRVRGGWERST